MKIEDIITRQNKLIASYESKIAEMEDTIKKYPWSKMGYDFSDWREYEVKFKKAQITELNLIIKALEKQIPVKPIKNNTGWNICPNCGCQVSPMENYCCGDYTIENGCGQKLLWEDRE